MRNVLISIASLLSFFGFITFISCGFVEEPVSENTGSTRNLAMEVRIEAEDFSSSNIQPLMNKIDSTNKYIQTFAAGWIAINVEIPLAGRYMAQLYASPNTSDKVICWIEDYHDNKDGRVYNITGNMNLSGSSDKFIVLKKDGIPLNTGSHKMKLHFDNDINVDWIKFTLLKEHQKTPKSITQKTTGTKWTKVWSDEFDLPEVDTTKWTYDFGNWGWGNNELQYYTSGRKENARIENGNLIIEARKNDMGNPWTSARLTTREKISFLYGKIEFRAKLPSNKGNWAAGWTLGDEYIDELSWPYCGEIDILESVGYEMDDETGNGIAHASAHSGAYYFKLGNQPTGVIEVSNMKDEYHTYSIEWYPHEIKSYVDENLYLIYNDTSTDLSWPFNKPQNLILNLAMGGGWAGYYGMDESVTSQKMTIDYVRVYELR